MMLKSGRFKADKKLFHSDGQQPTWLKKCTDSQRTMAASHDDYYQTSNFSSNNMPVTICQFSNRTS